MRKCLATKPGEPPKHVDMTAQEEAAFLADQQARNDNPKRALQKRSAGLSPAEERVYTILMNAGKLAKTDLPPETLDALNARRSLRGDPPV